MAICLDWCLMMKTISIVFSNHCDLDCSYCCIQSKNLSPVNRSLDDICSFIDKYYQDGSEIEFYGGEPTLHKDEINSLLEYIERRGLNVHTRLYTNGLFNSWTKEEITSICSRIDEILISLDGYEYEENRCRFSSKYDYDRCIDNINLIRNLECTLGISTVLFGIERYSSIYKNYLLFKELGISYFSYEPLTVFRTDKPVVIPKDHFFELIRQIYMIILDTIRTNTRNSLFVAKEIIAASWYSNGDKTRCSKIVRALSPRGNVYMCRDHAANEEEMFYSPKTIQFFSTNQFKSSNESFPVIESRENVLTVCPVKNIQYEELDIKDKLYWLSDDYQRYLIKPLYESIIVINSQNEELYPFVENVASNIDDIICYFKKGTKW